MAVLLGLGLAETYSPLNAGVCVCIYMYLYTYRYMKVQVHVNTCMRMCAQERFAPCAYAKVLFRFFMRMYVLVTVYRPAYAHVCGYAHVCVPMQVRM